MIGEFVEVRDVRKPEPWRIWVEYHWLSSGESAYAEAKRIMDSGWMKKRTNG